MKPEAGRLFVAVEVALSSGREIENAMVDFKTAEDGSWIPNGLIFQSAGKKEEVTSRAVELTDSSGQSSAPMGAASGRAVFFSQLGTTPPRMAPVGPLLLKDTKLGLAGRMVFIFDVPVGGGPYRMAAGGSVVGPFEPQEPQ